MSFDKDKFATYLRKHSTPHSQGRCARAMPQALAVGAASTSGHPVAANQYGSTLERNGFYVGGFTDLKTYVPVKGDVVIFEPHPGCNTAGHIQAYDGRRWLSDFTSSASGPVQATKARRPCRLSIAANKACSLLVLSTALLSGVACAEGPSGPIAPVVAMYRHFAWEALSSDTAAFGNGLASQSARALSEYFEPRLAKMIADDTACQRRTQAFCKLDFDILFDSQDPRVVDLSIAPGPSNTVDVRFKDPVTASETRITYKVSRQASGWRISNATYVKGGVRSLRSIFEGASKPQT